MIVSKLTAKGQITIPKKVREFLNIDVSDKIEFTLLEAGKVLMTSQQKPAQALFGMLGHRKPENPVSVEEMEVAIQDRRKKRAAK